MAKISVQAGSTGVSVNLFIQSSTATDGSGKTGLVFNSAGLTCYSMRQRTTATPVTLATSTVGNPWITGGFIEINSTAANGWYNFDIPNAVIGTGSPFASVHFQGASGMAPLPLEIELTAWNNQDPNAGGMTQLSSTGTLGSVSNVRGTATVILAAGVHTGAVVPIVQTASNALSLTTSADGRMANLDVAVSSRSTAGDAMALTSGERATVALAIGTSVMPESYRVAGSGASLAQMGYETIGHMGESIIAGTGKAVRKVDHTTTAMTFALTTDTSGNPTAITRTS